MNVNSVRTNAAVDFSQSIRNRQKVPGDANRLTLKDKKLEKAISAMAKALSGQQSIKDQNASEEDYSAWVTQRSPGYSPDLLKNGLQRPDEPISYDTPSAEGFNIAMELLRDHSTLGWKTQVSKISEHGFNFSSDGAGEGDTGFTAAILEFLTGDAPANAKTLATLFDRGVLTLKDKTIHIDLTAATPSQIESLVKNTAAVEGGTSLASDLNAMTDEERSNWSRNAKDSLGITQYRTSDVPRVADADPNVGNGDGALSTDEFLTALKAGYFEVQAGKIISGEKSTETVLKDRSRMLSELASLATDIHDTAGFATGSGVSDNNAINALKQFTTDFARFGAKLKELEKTGIPLTTSEKQRIEDIFTDFAHEIKPALVQGVELAQQNTANVRSDSPYVEPPSSPLAIISTVVNAVSAAFFVAGGVTSFAAPMTASAAAYAGGSGLFGVTAGLGFGFLDGDDPATVEDTIRAQFGDAFLEDLAASFQGFGRTTDFLKQNGLGDLSDDISKTFSGIRKVTKKTFEEVASANAIWVLTQQFKTDQHYNSSIFMQDVFSGYPNEVSPAGQALLDLAALGWDVAIWHRRASQHEYSFIYNTSGGRKPIVFFTAPNVTEEEVHRLDENGELDEALRTGILRNELASIHLFRDEDIGVTVDGSEDDWGRVIATGDAGIGINNNNVNFLRHHVQSKFGTELKDVDEMLREALGH
ncbi:hypothetical protein [uncultured Roseobacter sp.]|uniref:hypothetical protein n=1 Tax=uncultured Roseobacter sp. TaxID=114847 RepID=UPI002635EEF7|nr:hypothetical protein [uncultured Roseobacter sp.]